MNPPGDYLLVKSIRFRTKFVDGIFDVHISSFNVKLYLQFIDGINVLSYRDDARLNNKTTEIDFRLNFSID